MKKMRIDHVDAIARASAYVTPALDKISGRHQKESIENDLLRLAEVKKFLLYHLYNPGLPINVDEDPDSPQTETLLAMEPQDNGSKSTDLAW